MSGFVSVRDLLRSSPHSTAIRYKFYHNGKGKAAINIMIPRQIAFEAGIEIGTIVNVLYDAEMKMMKIVLLKHNEHGFRIHKGDQRKLCSTFKIAFLYNEKSGLPKEHVIVENYTIQSGLIFSLDNHKEA